MALADPQSITIDGTAISLPRSFQKDGTGTFVSPNGEYTLEVVPKTGPNTKVRTVRLRNHRVVSDPLVTASNVRVTDLLSLNIIRPTEGYTDDDIVKQLVGFFNWLTASTNANLKKIVAGEN